jgi:Second Messenger Oligonucleotide or Dinucleotide Synthetase domain
MLEGHLRNARAGRAPCAAGDCGENDFVFGYVYHYILRSLYIMPRTIDEGFRDFLTKLTPTSSESEGAKKHRASINACLTSNFGLRRFARIGSFGNGTSISGYSDVDYLASLPTEQLSGNSTYSLTKVRDALDKRFPNTGVRVNCPAVLVPFGLNAAERTEVVPADFVRESDGYKVYDIADCAGGWMKASPDAHNAYVRYVDDKLGGKAKPLIRFLKAWKYFMNVPISSFYLEMRVAKYASTETPIVYDIDVRNVLKLLLDNELASTQDPMGVSGYIRACATDVQRNDALSKLKTALTRAEKARDAAARNDIVDFR